MLWSANVACELNVISIQYSHRLQEFCQPRLEGFHIFYDHCEKDSNTAYKQKVRFVNPTFIVYIFISFKAFSLLYWQVARTVLRHGNTSRVVVIQAWRGAL